MRTSAKILCAVLLLFCVAASFIWYAAFREDRRGELKISFLNVGQGDSIYIETPGGHRVLVDGGPDGSVIRELGTVMPFYARSLDLVIAMAQIPAKVGGLANVFSRYSVATIARSAARSSVPDVQAFTAEVSTAQKNGTRLIILQRGSVIDLGSDAYIETLFPDRDASQMSASDGCLVLKLVFGATSFLFSCGSPAIETYLAALDGTKLHSDVLLAVGNDPELYIGVVSPEFAILPCGSSASSSVFVKLSIQTLTICNTVSFVSDGHMVTEK